MNIPKIKRLRKVSIQIPIVTKIFLIPLMAVLIGVIGISYISSMTVKESLLEEMKLNGIHLSERLIMRIEDYKDALEIINTMLDEKIKLGSSIVVANQDNLSSEKLKQLAKQIEADQVYWYNSSGKIIYSTVDRYLGWVAPEGHPVNEYNTSGRMSFVERDIRKDSESDNYGKSGYLRADNGEFVQIVISADDVKGVTEQFSYQKLVEELITSDGILYAIYIDKNLKAIAHSDQKHIGIDLSEDIGATTVISSGEPYYSECFYKTYNVRIYDVIVPVVIDGELVGAFNVGYSMENIHLAVQRSNFRICFLGTLLLWIVTFNLNRVQKKQIIDPIVKLKQDVQGISLEDNISYRLPINNKDPFLDLRRSANAILKTAQAYFESMIENQEELIATNEELEATLGQLSANEQQLRAQYDEIKKQESYIQFLADHDPLTELPNRRKFTENLQEDLYYERKGTVLLLDIDNFKNINDTLGHMYGDKVLKYVADFLKAVICENISVYRFGGDEFLINIHGITDIAEISYCIKRIMGCFQKNHIIDEIQNYITVSIGAVHYPLHGSSVEELLIKADIAMYTAKRAGKNQYKIFNELMTSSFNEKVQMEKLLRTAVQEEKFMLVYQPIIETSTGKINCFEALIRMRDNNLSPGIFIPIAEETRLIVPIGRWVIKEAICQLRKWMNKGYAPKPIAINLSPRQMQDTGLVDFLVNQLEENNIEPSLIEIEITENVLIENREENIKTMKKMQALGMTIALDDFGTGYSSLNYLTYIPVDKIKLDKSIKDKFIYYENIQVMNSLISLAHGLHLKVVAEGVEEIEEFKRLKEGGSDYMQGYLFSKPVPAAEVEKTFQHNYLKSLGLKTIE